jgi:hypothetical protein|tara:strand:- start:165 stop:827 length:663 start_codon:yes stop_codon:yes gene_type:complete
MKESIFIATPCFEHKVNTSYVLSLLSFNDLEIDIFPNFMHDSLLPRVRNELITIFYEKREQFTHLLWLDSDVSIPAVGLRKLLDRNVDVISAPIPIKEKNINRISKNPQSIEKVYKQIDENLYLTTAAATGCLLMSKKSVVDIIECSDFYHDNDDTPRKIYNVFETRVKDRAYLSEDWDLCYKLRSIGYDIHVDDSFPSSHNGFFRWDRVCPKKINFNYN